MESILDDYIGVPEYAREDVARQGFRPQEVDSGVSIYGGNDHGVAFRFVNHSEYNKTKSKLTKIEQSDTFDMIEWTVDKRNHPSERVKFLPPELLEFDDDGDCVGGRLMPDYQRFKSGLKSPGLPLSRWDVLSQENVVTLAGNGIFSVEQFAATPRNKIVSKFSGEIVEALERAIFYVNGKAARDESANTASEMLKMAQENSKLADQVSEMREQMQKLVAAAVRSPQKRNRKKKVTQNA